MLKTAHKANVVQEEIITIISFKKQCGRLAQSPPD
jgi:hypothetical protein